MLTLDLRNDHGLREHVVVAIGVLVAFVVGTVFITSLLGAVTPHGAADEAAFAQIKLLTYLGATTTLFVVEGFIYLLYRWWRHTQRANIYKAIFDYAHECIIVSSVGHGIASVNRETEQVFGHPNSFLVGKSTEIFQLNRDNYLKTKAEFEKHMADGTAATMVLPFRRKDGTTFIGEFRASYLKGPDGKPKVRISSIHDLTDRLRIENTVREQDKLLHDLADNIPEVFFVIASDFSRTDYISPSYQTVWGDRQEDLHNDPSRWTMAILPEEREAVMASAKSLLAGGPPIVIRFHITRRTDGAIRAIESRVLPLRNAAGAIDRIAGVSRDITDEVERTEETARLATLVQTSPDAIYRITLDGTITTWNPGAEKMYGVVRATALGKSVVELTPADLQAQTAWILGEIRAGRSVIGLETESVGRDGRRFSVSLTVAPIHDERGRVEAASVVERDITEQKRVQRELVTAQGALEVERAKEDFVSLVSHQLKTPLTAIGGYASMLRDGDAGPVNRKQKEFLRVVQDSNRRMVDLIDALLNTTRVELGLYPIEPQPLSFAAVIGVVLTELRLKTRAKKAVVDVDLAPGLPEINADETLLRIILENLLSNAIKYSPVGGRVTLGVRKSPTDFVITVTDQGIGIPADQQDRIFTKLYRADNARAADADGTGLGLYIVKAIVQASGGHIRFTSVENQGATFVMELPLTGMRKRVGEKQLV